MSMKNQFVMTEDAPPMVYIVEQTYKNMVAHFSPFILRDMVIAMKPELANGFVLTKEELAITLLSLTYTNSPTVNQWLAWRDNANQNLVDSL